MTKLLAILWLCDLTYVSIRGISFLQLLCQILWEGGAENLVWNSMTWRYILVDDTFDSLRLLHETLQLNGIFVDNRKTSNQELYRKYKLNRLPNFVRNFVQIHIREQISPMRAPNFLSQIRSEFWNKFKEITTVFSLSNFLRICF